MSPFLSSVLLLSIVGVIAGQYDDSDHSQPFEIRSVSCKRCMAVAGGVVTLGGQIVSWNCDDMTRSQWRFVKAKPGSQGMQIEGVGSSLCLAVAGGSPAPGATIVTWNCDNLPRSQWKIVEALPGSGGNQIQNIASGLCLAIAGGSPADGAGIVQWNCDNMDRSQWNPFVEPPKITFNSYIFNQPTQPVFQGTTPSYV